MNVKIIAGPKSWIEGAATQQLEKMAQLPDMDRVIGMPDLHPGLGCPVGAVFITHDRLYPHLIGSDIGCGMLLWKTSIRPGKADKFAKKLKGLEAGIADPVRYLEEAGVEPTGFEHSLGTLGQGNHFAEILAFDDIREPERVTELTGDAKSLLLVHSGSRGFGEQILYNHTASYRDSGIGLHEMAAATDYLCQHNRAVEWARLNRKIIGNRIIEALGAQAEPLIDTVHNFVEPVDTSTGRVWVHRKGAIPSTLGPVVIPGSRGAHSYLVEPVGEQEVSGWSLSHGAGRKMSRKDARVKFDQGSGQGSIEKLRRTKFGSFVICEDRTMLMEEAPDAYKSIDRVIQDLVDHGLIKVLALMKPVLTYKVRR